jgi:hypothetical protein
LRQIADCSAAQKLDGKDLSREPLEVRKATLASLLRPRLPGLQFNQHLCACDAPGGRRGLEQARLVAPLILQTTTATMPQWTPTSKTPLRRSNQLMRAPTGDLNNSRDNPRLGAWQPKDKSLARHRKSTVAIMGGVG